MLAAWRIAGLTALLAFDPPTQPEPESSVEPPAEPSDPLLVRHHGEALVGQLGYNAKMARRERIVRSSFGLGLSGTQLGLGVYGLVELREVGPGLQRASIGQTIAGGVGIVLSTVNLSMRSPLERLVREPVFERLAADPMDEEAAAELHRAWKRAAEKSRRFRLVAGSLNIAGGGTLLVLSTIGLATPSSDTASGERLWSYMTFTSALGLTLSGVSLMVLPAESERSYAAHVAGHPEPRPFVRVRPQLGGAVVFGRF